MVSLFAFVWGARCRARACEESGVAAERQTASRQSGQGPTRKVAGGLKGISSIGTKINTNIALHCSFELEVSCRISIAVHRTHVHRLMSAYVCGCLFVYCEQPA